MWQGETAGLQAERYRSVVAGGAACASTRREELASHQATWLWRTLRAAESAGLDVSDVVRQAVDSRSLAGARDLASVIDARIRRITGPLVPQPPRPWSERVPVSGRP